MSVAFESVGVGGRRGTGSRYNIDPPGFISRIPFMAMYGPSDPPIGGNGGAGGDKESNSSSIGKDSDLSVESAEADEAGESEVQSNLKGPLDTLDSLEDVLPFKKGISSCYKGRSKSFTSLAEASAISSINDLAKPETPYSKKRKNKLATTLYLEREFGKTSKHSCIGLDKLETSGTLNNFATLLGSGTNSNSSSSSSLHGLPPLHPQSTKGSPITEAASPPPELSMPPYRSLSLSDLQSSTSTPSSAGASPSSAGVSSFSADASPSSAGVSPTSADASSSSSASSSGGK